MHILFEGNDNSNWVTASQLQVEQQVQLPPQSGGCLSGNAHRMNGSRQVFQDLKLPFAALHHPQRRQNILSDQPRLLAPALYWDNVICCPNFCFLDKCKCLTVSMQCDRGATKHVCIGIHGCILSLQAACLCLLGRPSTRNAAADGYSSKMSNIFLSISVAIYKYGLCHYIAVRIVFS